MRLYFLVRLYWESSLYILTHDIKDLQWLVASLRKESNIFKMTPRISFHAPSRWMRIERIQRASEHGLGLKAGLVRGDRSNFQIVRLPVGPAQSAFSDIAKRKLGSAIKAIV